MAMVHSEHNLERRIASYGAIHQLIKALAPLTCIDIVAFFGILSSALLLAVVLVGTSAQSRAQASVPHYALEQGSSNETVLQLRRLIAEGEFESAYQLGRRVEDVEAGAVDFDYLFGLAALESGRAAEATLAFERVLALRPNFLGARLDMARAQTQLGQLEQARTSLLELKAQDPPEQAVAAIDNYLAAIESNSSDTRLSAYAEIGGGYNSNVANATSESSVFLPVLQAELTLSGSSVARGDGYLQAAAGARWDQKITRHLEMTVAGDLNGRTYPSEGNFDEISPSITGALRYKLGYNALQLFARNQRLDLDYEQYRNTLSLGLAYVREIDQGFNALGFFQHSRIRYDNETNAASDSNAFIVGAGVTKQFGDLVKTSVSGNVYAGRDNDTKARADGDSRLVGVKVSVDHTLARDLHIRAVTTGQINQFDEPNLLFQRKRTDRYLEAEIAMRWNFLPRWSFLPSVKWNRNFSNIPLNDTQQFEALLRIRRDLY